MEGGRENGGKKQKGETNVLHLQYAYNAMWQIMVCSHLWVTVGLCDVYRLGECIQVILQTSSNNTNQIPMYFIYLWEVSMYVYNIYIYIDDHFTSTS